MYYAVFNVLFNICSKTFGRVILFLYIIMWSTWGPTTASPTERRTVSSLSKQNQPNQVQYELLPKQNLQIDWIVQCLK